MVKKRWAMRKWGWKTIALSIAIIAASLWLLEAPFVSSYLSRTLGMRVSVATVFIGPSEIKMKKFKISNPYKYRERYALKAKSILSSYQWKNLTSNPRIIDQIEIDQIKLAIEFSNALGTQNNWADLISKIPKKKEHAKEVIVSKLILTNVTVNVVGMGFLAKGETRTIDRMEFANVSSKEGFPTNELISQIFGRANLMQYIKDVIPGGPGGIIKMLKIFGNRANEKGQENPGPSL